MKKAAIYTRYSTEHQTENSTQTQIEACSVFCNKNDFEVVAIFSDEETTGTNTDRPEFVRLLDAAKKHLFDIVVIYDITRGSRDVIDWFVFRKQMHAFGVEVMSVHDNIGNILDPSNFLTELITVGIGQHQVLQSRQKSIDGSYTKAKQGLFMGGNAPLGYDIVERQYKINKSESKAVELIFNMLAKDYSPSNVVEALKINGYKSKNGNDIKLPAIYDIVRNKRYTGTFEWAKKQNREMHKFVGRTNPDSKVVRIENIIPAIVTKEVFDKANAKLGTKLRKQGSKEHHDYILSGLIVCPKCGAIFHGLTNKSGKGIVTMSYVCPNKAEKKCNAQNISAILLETEVQRAVKKWLLNLDLNSIVEKFIKGRDLNSDYIQTKKELKKVNNEIDNILSAIKKGLVFDEMKNDIEMLKKQQITLNDNISRFENNQNTQTFKNKMQKLILTAKTKAQGKELAEVVRMYCKKITPTSAQNFELQMGGVGEQWLPK